MAQWSSAEIDLSEIFIDQFSKEGGLGSCGDLTFELKDNTVNGVEYTVIFLNEEKNKLMVQTDDPADEGKYTVTLVVTLPQYPDAQSHTEYITANILSVNITKSGRAAWILLPFLVILFSVLAFLGGMIYQRKKDGYTISPMHPFGTRDKIRDGDG